VPLDRQTKRRRRSYQKGIAHQSPRIQILLGKHTRRAYVMPELNYDLVCQNICKEEPPEDADEKFTRFTVVRATKREYLTTSDLWDRNVRKGKQLVIETMEQVSVELMTGFTCLRLLPFRPHCGHVDCCELYYGSTTSAS